MHKLVQVPCTAIARLFCRPRQDTPTSPAPPPQVQLVQLSLSGLLGGLGGGRKLLTPTQALWRVTVEHVAMSGRNATHGPDTVINTTVTPTNNGDVVLPAWNMSLHDVYRVSMVKSN